MMRIVYAAPYQMPVVREITGSLESMQALVGGYIEIVPIELEGGRFEVVVNEEGRLAWKFNEPDLEKQTIHPNRWVAGIDILGPFFVCREGGDGLSAEEAVVVANYISRCSPVRATEVRKPGFAVFSFGDDSPN